MRLTYRPIDVWPGKLSQHRLNSTFKAAFNTTLRDLDLELRQLDADGAMVQLAVRESDIRIDGGLRGDSRPSHPGVILSFESKHGPLRYPCDRFTDWRDNLRAITLALEALRRVDRYGVTSRAEQYSGWKALPGALVTPGPMNLDEAAAVVADAAAAAHGGKLFAFPAMISHPDKFREAYRLAAKHLHPDAGKSTPEAWKRFQEAADLLRQHHERTAAGV